MKRMGFTLVEILVVIAIISVLAAILMPVFVQAKKASKKTSCLSNVRQLGQANALYMQDYDDVYPSVHEGAVAQIQNPVKTLLPRYVGSPGVFYCPDRTDGGCLDASGAPGRCLGYGYNWGFYNPWDDGIGLFHPVEQGVGLHDFILRGKNGSEVSQTATTYLLGDTWSAGSYTLAVFENWNGAGSARHAGRFNYSFADTHARSVAMRHGVTNPDAYVVGNQTRFFLIGQADTLSPASRQDLLGFCSSPDSSDCAAIVDWFLANTAFDDKK